MRLPRRIHAAIAGLFLRTARPRPIDGEDLARADLPTQPGGKGLRFNERVRNAFHKSWLRLRRP